MEELRGHKSWYLLYAKARQEKTALENLERQGYTAYLPLIEQKKRVGTHLKNVIVPMFPRYLFVSKNPDRPGRRSIISARGVISLVTFGDRPAIVEDKIIHEIRTRENDSGHVQLVDLKPLIPGEKVRLNGGIMADHIGLFERRCDSDRVVILLNLLGREVRVRALSNSISRTS